MKRRRKTSSKAKKPAPQPPQSIVIVGTESVTEIEKIKLHRDVAKTAGLFSRILERYRDTERGEQLVEVSLRGLFQARGVDPADAADLGARAEEVLGLPPSRFWEMNSKQLLSEIEAFSETQSSNQESQRNLKQFIRKLQGALSIDAEFDAEPQQDAESESKLQPAVSAEAGERAAKLSKKQRLSELEIVSKVQGKDKEKLTIKTTAELLGCGEQNVRRLIRDKKLTAVGEGDYRKVTRDSILQRLGISLPQTPSN